MKFFSLLTAVLSFEAALAIPLREEKSGNTLVRRVYGSGNHGSGDRTRPKPLPGTSGREKYSPQAPAANDRESLERMVDSADEYHERNRGRYGKLEVTKSPPRGSRRGKTYVHDTEDSDGEPLTIGYQGTDRGRDHAVAARDHEERDPSFRKAKYLPESPEAKKNKRTTTIGGLKPMPLPRRGDGSERRLMREENPKASNRLIPINRDKVGIPPLHGYAAAQSTSDRQDRPLAKATAQRAKERGSSLRYESNLDERTERDFQQGKVSAKPLRGLKKPGLPDPVWQQTRDDSQEFGWSDGLVSRSSRSSGSPKSKSPTYRVRSPRRRRHRSPARDDSDSDKVKRDIVDAATKHQSNADSQSKEGQQADNKQGYRDLMQQYDMIRTNATDLIMPILYEMVNGSNSYVVWDAAWEIATLADPSILLFPGPFSQGMHTLDSWEDEVQGQVDEETFNGILALNSVIIPLYQDTWKKCNDTLGKAGYIDALDALVNALATNDTTLTAIKQDTSNTDAINEFFTYGPDTSELAWWPGDEDFDWPKLNDSNSTLSGQNSTISGMNSTSLGSSNSTASPRVRLNGSNSTSKAPKMNRGVILPQ
ncbi:MAG: hypothetical protein Q9167_000605 [Letrouitia subvulpina]